MKKKIIRWNIKPRIFLMISLLIIAVFTAVFVSFNVFINNYVKSNVKSQLAGLTYTFSQHEDKSIIDANKDLPDISYQKKNPIGTHAEVFVLDANYTITKYDETSKKSELQQLGSSLEKDSIKLDTINNLFVQTETEDYYISVVNDEKEEDSFYVFFVNVTSVETLIETINTILVIIMGIALLICFLVANFITNSITRPVRKLAKYAEQMGQGDFTPNNFSFSDKEFLQLAEIMNASSKRLDQYDSDQRTFFQNASHELRTPLMSIKCHAEGIAYNLMDTKTASKIILCETDRLSDLVEELLYISKLDTLTNVIDMQELDLRETLSLCVERLTAIAEKRNINFIFDFDDTPVLFYYNEKYMERVCSNLISNALRYAKESIILSCTCKDIIMVSVIDDGNGISEHDLPHIFDRFYKGENGKYGIGLSIVKSIIQLHNGTIVVYSTGDQTEFRITFQK